MKALVKNNLFGKPAIDHAVDTTIMGTARYANVNTTKVWY